MGCMYFGNTKTVNQLDIDFGELGGYNHASEPLYPSSTVILGWLQLTRAQITLFWGTVLIFTTINFHDGVFFSVGINSYEYSIRKLPSNTELYGVSLFDCSPIQYVLLCNKLHILNTS